MSRTSCAPGPRSSSRAAAAVAAVAAVAAATVVAAMLLSDEAIAAISASRLEIVRSVAEKYWVRNGRDSTRPDEWRDRARSSYGVGFPPLMGRGVPVCAVW